jgi:DNA adenine methylase
VSRRRFIGYLSDTNIELITAYNVIKVNAKGVTELLRTYDTEYKKYPPCSKQQQECYKRLRDDRNSNEESSDVEIAARFIALNKTGHYRVNKKGKYNNPVCRYKNPLICDSSNIENVSNVLRYSEAIISAGDYRDMIEKAQKGDFVYFDPPYDPVSLATHLILLLIHRLVLVVKTKNNLLMYLESWQIEGALYY